MIMSQLAIVYGAYIVATASPGPSTMAIMAAAMRHGRAPALVLAAGVITGSLFWALLAATGISAILAAYADILYVIKIVGGFYLLSLAFRAGRSAMQSESGRVDAEAGYPAPPYGLLYRQGLLMHISNPKAVLAWVAIMSLGLQDGAPTGVLPAIVGGCALLGSLIFGGYAILFSTAPMVMAYLRLRRWIEGGLCALLTVAGLKLISTDR